MKLILCLNCQDIFKLDYQERTCKCGDCWGYYEGDGLRAHYGGADAVPIGFANDSLADAIGHRPDVGLGRLFKAFVIPKECPTMEHKG